MLRALGLAPAGASDAPVANGRVLDAILAALYASPSRIVIVPVQDLFGWPGRINLPGTVGSANWSWRMPVAIEDMGREPALAARIEKLRNTALRAGR